MIFSNSSDHPPDKRWPVEHQIAARFFPLALSKVNWSWLSGGHSNDPIWGHCIKVTLLSGSRERNMNSCGIAKIIFPKWPEAIWAEWRVHVPEVVPCQSDMGPAKWRDVFDDVIRDGDAVFPQISD